MAEYIFVPFTDLPHQMNSDQKVSALRNCFIRFLFHPLTQT